MLPLHICSVKRSINNYVYIHNTGKSWMQRYMLVNIHMNSKCVASNLNKIINHRVHFIFGYSAFWPSHPHCWHSKYDFHIKLNHSNYTKIALKLFLNDFILIPEFINWTYLHDCVWFLIPHFICSCFFRLVPYYLCLKYG